MKCTIAVIFAFCTLAVAAHAQPLVGHWTFDETSGTTAVDSTGGTNGVIGSNVTLGVSGAVGTAFAFTGGATDADIVNMGDAAVISLLEQRDAATISFWMNWTVSPPAVSTAFSIAKNISPDPVPCGTCNQDFIDMGNTGSSSGHHTEGGVTGGINIDGFKTGVINTTGQDNGGSLVPDSYPGGPALNDGAWHLLTMTLDSEADELFLYLDGAAVGQGFSTQMGFAFEDFDDAMNKLEVGRLARTGECCGYNGLVDDVQIYARALTADEVSFLFNNPGAVVIPEPASLALVGVGVVGLVVLGRQRRRLM